LSPSIRVGAVYATAVTVVLVSSRIAYLRVLSIILPELTERAR
jgi:hypothetical protein